MLDLAKAAGFAGHDIDGHSLVPLLSGKVGAVDLQRPQWALSQGHMADNAISWFVLREGDMKIIVYGTGQENEPQLFNSKYRLRKPCRTLISMNVSERERLWLLQSQLTRWRRWISRRLVRMWWRA